MGHITHLRKQFKSLNTYDDIITMIKRRKNPLSTLWEVNGSSFQQTWITFTQSCFVPSWVEIGPVVLEKIFKLPPCIFVIISHWIRLRAFIWTSFSPHHQRTLCKCSMVLERIFKFRQCIFSYFIIITPWKRVGPFICIKLNLLNPSIHCVKSGWNWLVVLEKIFKFYQLECISAFS